MVRKARKRKRQNKGEAVSAAEAHHNPLHGATVTELQGLKTAVVVASLETSRAGLPSGGKL
jgi:hypothetical protein